MKDFRRLTGPGPRTKSHTRAGTLLGTERPSSFWTEEKTEAFIFTEFAVATAPPAGGGHTYVTAGLTPETAERYLRPPKIAERVSKGPSSERPGAPPSARGLGPFQGQLGGGSGPGCLCFLRRELCPDVGGLRGHGDVVESSCSGGGGDWDGDLGRPCPPLGHQCVRPGPCPRA